MTIARSTIFLVWFAAMTAVLAIVFLPTLVLSRRGAAVLGYTWSAAVFWGLHVFAGTRFEVRGMIPPSGVLVAVKHMSMWDTMAVYYLLDDPAIVL
jgi:1-acyl-sn-glycerol-3-phosphate acyltransferase